MMWYVYLGLVCIAIAAATVGTFLVIRRQALVSDALAHAVLPGIVFAFLLVGKRHLSALFAGATLSTFIAYYLIDWLQNHTPLKSDSAIGSVLAGAFGIGIAALTFLQKLPYEGKAGLNTFLFGNAAAILPSDTLLFALLACTILAIFLLLFRYLTLISFDKFFAFSSGIPVKSTETLFLICSFVVIVMATYATGVVLTVGLLIIPVVGARLWTYRLKPLWGIATLIAILATLLGTYCSQQRPYMPTGPWIVIWAAFFAFASFLFSPKQGIIARYLQHKRFRHKQCKEHILKAFYKLWEDQQQKSCTLETLRSLCASPLTKKILKQMKKDGLIKEKQSYWYLTEKGWEEAIKVVRLHRLIELYMAEYASLSPEQVHSYAERLEHLLPETLQQELERMLGHRKKDPHEKPLP